MKKTIKFVYIFIFTWIVLSTFSIVNAASAEIKSSGESVNVGDKATVTVTVNAATCNLKVSGSATDTIIDFNLDGVNKTTTKTYTIDTSKAGTYTVSLTGDVTDGETDENTKINKSVSIVVNEKKPEPEPETPTTPENPSTPETPAEQPKEKSSNAYLSTLGVRIKSDLAEELGVETNEYDFSGFSKKKTTYNVTIPSNVDYLKVEYKTADSNATVKVTGNSGFEVGSSNKIKVKVTAEDGKTTETYTIKVTKLAEEEEKPGNVIEDEEGLYLTSLSLDGIEISPEFAKDTYAYTATLNDSNITSVDVVATANKGDASIVISGNTNLVIGENTINIVVKQEGSVTQTVYQITLTKETVSSITTSDEDIEDSNLMDDIMGSINKYVIIAVSVVILMIVAVIVLILLRKENKRLKEEDIEEKNTEYNVYENDEKEFETQNEEIKLETNETETKNKRKSRREKGRHSK